MWDALQPFPAAARADQNMGFLGKCKDIALTTSRIRNQLWAQGISPSLGLRSPIPHIKKCFLESKEETLESHFITCG